MSTGLGVSKLVNILRGRLMLIHGLSEVYKPGLTRTKEKLMELIKEKADAAFKSDLAGKVKVLKGFYTVEMAPPTRGEITKLQFDFALAREFIKSRCYLYMTVKQAWLLFLVGTEIFLWFFIGETIGKRHIVGYDVSE